MKSFISLSRVTFCRYIFLVLIGTMIISLYGMVFSQSFKDKPQLFSPKVIVNKPKKIRLTLSSLSDISVMTCQELNDKFVECKYELIKNDLTGYEVARVYLATFPKDFASLGYSQKKQLFLKSLLPLILETNEKIMADRKKLLRLIHLKESKMKLSLSHHHWLFKMAKKYRLKKVCMRELKKRMDIIPVSLALSQAITETGWGTSYAAREKRSSFGFTVLNRVISFKSLRHSVEAYIHTLNSHPAYKPLRDIRACLRHEKKTLCGLELAQGLEKYSTCGQAYIEKIQKVIRHNNLKQFDTARLTCSL